MHATGARTYAKSDPIDALAVARAALREPDLPTAHLDDDAREIRLLVDHRQDLVAERTRHINRVRWHSHEIDPSWEPNERGLTALENLDLAEERLVGNDTALNGIARDLIHRIGELSIEINSLAAELDDRTSKSAHLRAIPGVAALSAAKFIAELARIDRFKSKNAFARHNSTAPLPVWSGNRERHRLSRTGNRQLNAAIRRIALTQARYHPDAIANIERRIDNSNLPQRCHPRAQTPTLRRRPPRNDSGPRSHLDPSEQTKGPHRLTQERGVPLTEHKRGEDRCANPALHIAVIVRTRYCPKTCAYVARRTTDGLSKPEIIHCIKRYLTREAFTAIRSDIAAMTT